MSTDYNFMWKFVFGGAGGTGKTTFLLRFLEGDFSADTKITIGCQFKAANIQRYGYRIGLMLWDLGGQERFRFIQGEYIKGAVGGYVFFDSTNLGSFGQVYEWVDMIRKHSSPSIPIVLVGSKLDLTSPEEQPGIHEMANQYVQDLGLMCYAATSSRSDLNIRETIYYLVDLLLYNKTMH